MRLDGLGTEDERSEIARFDRPSAIRARTSCSRSVSSASGSGSRGRRRASRRWSGRGRTPFDDWLESVDEHGDVRHPLLEQIPGPLGVLLEETHRVARLQVLRQHEHAHIRMRGPNGLGRDESLVGERRRHADVDDRDIGMLAGHDPKELLRVVDLADDVDARALEEARRPLPQEHRVVGDHDAHGISARTGEPGRLVVVHAQAARPTRRSGPRDRRSCPRARGRALGAVRADVITSESPTSSASTSAFVAPAWTATGPVISAMRKYAADSTEPGNRSSGSLVTLIGIEARSRSASTAAPSPSLDRTAG